MLNFFFYYSLFNISCLWLHSSTIVQIPPHDRHPCCSAIYFPLSGRILDLHPLERAMAHKPKRTQHFCHVPLCYSIFVPSVLTDTDFLPFLYVLVVTLQLSLSPSLILFHVVLSTSILSTPSSSAVSPVPNAI